MEKTYPRISKPMYGMQDLAKPHVCVGYILNVENGKLLYFEIVCTKIVEYEPWADNTGVGYSTPEVFRSWSDMNIRHR